VKQARTLPGPDLHADAVGPSLVLPALRPLRGRLLIALAAVVGAILVGVSQGSADIPFTTVVRILASKTLGLGHTTWPQTWEEIVWQIRLPRVLLAGLVGATLAFSGAGYQGVLRNPLADPYLIGVAAGAGLGATIVMVSPLPYAFGTLSLVPPAAFAGAVLAVSISYGLARSGSVAPSVTLILAGVAVSAAASSVMYFLIMANHERAVSVQAWLLGGFNTATWQKVGIVLPYSLIGGAVVLASTRLLNVLQLDEEEAQQLGVPVERVKLLVIAGASLATAAAVSVSGLIGFVGLIVPHAVRLLWGFDYRRLVPMSMAAGAVFLILADVAARSVRSPDETPVGVVTALCGAPFFLWLLRRQRPAGAPGGRAIF
jgi:iron complex transport system permease protein